MLAGNWLKVNKLSVNVAKTKAMIFHMPQKQIHNPRLTIAGSNIEFIDNFNFLGITINKHLNWTKHMDTLSAKIAKTVGILNTLKHVLPTNILKMIYNSLILCHLNYGILLWGAQHNSSRKMRVLGHFTIHMVEIIQLYSIIYRSTTYVVGIPSSSVFQPYIWLDTISNSLNNTK